MLRPKYFLKVKNCWFLNVFFNLRITTNFTSSTSSTFSEFGCADGDDIMICQMIMRMEMAVNLTWLVNLTSTTEKGTDTQEIDSLI